MKGKWVFINDRYYKNQQAKIHFSDLTIQRAYGVFDFFRVHQFQPLYLNEHLDRFYFSALEMHLKINYSKDELYDIILQFIKKNGLSDCGIRITVTGGNSEDGFEIYSSNLIISSYSLKTPSELQYKNGIQLVTYPYQRQLPHVKSIDYIMAIWLQPFIKKQGVDDVLYVNHDYVTECPRSNIFFIEDNDKLITPASGILKGITRKKIIEAIGKNFEIIEREVTLKDIKNASAAFITSTSKNVLPISKIDNTNYDIKSNTIIPKIYRIMNYII